MTIQFGLQRTSPRSQKPGFTGYEYDLTQYTKDEYIKMIDDRNASLEDQMTQAQEAMCEIYEMMA